MHSAGWYNSIAACVLRQRKCRPCAGPTGQPGRLRRQRSSFRQRRSFQVCRLSGGCNAAIRTECQTASPETPPLKSMQPTAQCPSIHVSNRCCSLARLSCQNPVSRRTAAPRLAAVVGDSACNSGDNPSFAPFASPPMRSFRTAEPRLRASRRNTGELLRLAQVRAALGDRPALHLVEPGIPLNAEIAMVARFATTIRPEGAVVISTSPELRICAASSPVCHHTIYGSPAIELAERRSTPSLVASTL